MDFEQLGHFERINVIGTSGSGKSTFARELAKVLNLPYHEMDRLFWKPDWQQSPEDEFVQQVREVTSQPKWVLDGNYRRTMPDKWNRAQLVIWLDLSFVRTVLRVTKRAIRRAFTQQEIWPGTGNRESLAKSFLSRESVIWWAITTHRQISRKYTALMASAEYSHLCFVRLRTPKSVASFLEGIRRIAECSHASEPAAGSVSRAELSPPAR